MRPTHDIPESFRETVKLGPVDRITYNTVIAAARLLGQWQTPMRASGDLATMRFLDKVYWVHKAERPIRRATRGSGLEAFFEGQSRHAWSLPAGFVPKDELTLSAAGDLLPHSYLKGSRSHLYEEVDDLLFGADVSMGNLECVLSEQPYHRLVLSARSGAPVSYDSATFDVVKGSRQRAFSFLSAACNHSLDFGPKGAESTMNKLRAAGIAFHGINDSERDSNLAAVVDQKGFKLGILSFTFGLNGRNPPPDRPWLVNRAPLNDGVAGVDLSRMVRQLEHCRREAVDFVVAQLHWGFEHEFYPRPEQIDLAHHLAELGVDTIIGHHPHVVQPMECYRTRRDPERVVPIYYSLGNLLNPCSADYLCESDVARITLARGTAADGPLRTYVRAARKVRVKQVADRVALKVQLTVQEKG
jgi:poly-gamma-glutamate synthesis protein (capsule biosynthesis protein)